MAVEQLNIGFISPGPATWPHYDSFTALIPEFVKFDFQGLGLYGKSLYEIGGKKAEIVSRIGAPTEVMNPGLFADLKSSLNVPVTTALSASVAALRTYRAKRLLLLTPFESRLNQMIEDYLGGAGFEVRAPRSFADIGEAGQF